MKMRLLLIALLIVNLILLALVLSPLRVLHAQPVSERIPAVLRARSLEIVDAGGRTRAQIVVAPAAPRNGVKYPETVLFRLIDSEGQPTIKMAASVEGSGMDMLGGPDTNGWYGLQFIADGKRSMIRALNKSGRDVVIQP
jgi:hypothetical protein